MSVLTVRAIKVLLYYYLEPEVDHNYEDAMDHLCRVELLERDMEVGEDASPLTYRITQKGIIHIRMLTETPLPISVWADPRDNTVYEMRACDAAKLK